MASRKITRSAKQHASAKATPAKKAPAKSPPAQAAPPAAARKPAPGAPPLREPRKPGDALASAPTSRPGYLRAGLEALARRVRLRDQAEAKKLEPALDHLAQAYDQLLGKR